MLLPVDAQAPAPREMHDVFLSYSGHDRERARWFIDAFQTRGWSVFWDREKIPPGTEFEHFIEEALEHSHVVVVLWSMHSVSARWVRMEASEALSRDVLVPVMIDHLKAKQLPFSLRQVHATPMYDWDGRSNHPGLELLRGAVTATLSRCRARKATSPGDESFSQARIRNSMFGARPQTPEPPPAPPRAPPPDNAAHAAPRRRAARHAIDPWEYLRQSLVADSLGTIAHHELATRLLDIVGSVHVDALIAAIQTIRRERADRALRKECRVCREPNANVSSACVACGAAFPGLCSVCNGQNQAHLMFCVHCGASLADPQAKPPARTPTGVAWGITSAEGWPSGFGERHGASASPAPVSGTVFPAGTYGLSEQDSKAVSRAGPLVSKDFGRDPLAAPPPPSKPASRGLPAGNDPLLGVTINGRYRVECLIGVGGMGRVYEVEHLALGKRMALKVIALELSSKPELVARFRREATATASLDSEHIVRVVDCDVTAEGLLFMVMDLLQGEPLDELIARGGISKARVVRVVLETCRALSVAHAAGIVHRDIKPSNIYLVHGEAGPKVKILDFGVAKLDASATGNTRTGAFIGTPYYMSPEQCEGSKGLDARTDIYSLGIVLYELLTGAPPYQEGSLIAVLLRKIRSDPEPPSDRDADLVAWDGVVMKAIAREAKDRFGSALDFANAVRALHDNDTSGTPSDAALTTETAAQLEGNWRQWFGAWRHSKLLTAPVPPGA
jgi:eukaryotic-like serine/threonine-protein kinase